MQHSPKGKGKHFGGIWTSSGLLKGLVSEKGKSGDEEVRAP